MIRHAIDLVIGAVIVCGMAFLFGGPPVRAADCGLASFYAEAHQGKLMANGKPFNMRAMTTASNSHPLGSVLRVTSGKRSVVVTVTDRGGFTKYGRMLDLSKAAFAKLAPASRGVIPVCVTRVR
jgi:rare lipoprotein A